MQRLITIIKSIKPKQLLTVFLAGCLLTISTACNQGTNLTQADRQKATEMSKRAMSDTYDNYDANQDFKGGMNGYNDDRRYDGKAAAKAKTLVDTAERRQADDLGEFTDNVLERSVLNEDVNEKATKAFSRKVERNKDKASEYVDNKSDKLKRNLEKVPGGAKEAFDEATDTAEGALNDAAKATRKTTKNIKGNFEDLT